MPGLLPIIEPPSPDQREQQMATTEALPIIEPPVVEAARSNLRATSDMEPGRAAESMKLGNAFGYGPEAAFYNFDMASGLYEENVAEGTLEVSPTLREFIAADPFRAASSRDDLGVLAEIERKFKLGRDAWNAGTLDLAIGKLRTAQLFGDDSRETEARIQELKAKRPKELDQRGLVDDIIANSATILPQFGEQLYSRVFYGLQGASAGAAAGGLLGLAGGPAAPATSPLTATALAAAGGYAGQTYGGMVMAFTLEAGAAYDEFLEIEGVDRAVAKAAAFLVGTGNAAIEFAQFNTIAKLVPGLADIKGALTRQGMKQALRNPSVRAGLARVALQVGRGWSLETAQEVLQEAVTFLGGQAVRQASGLDIESFGTFADRMQATAYQAGTGFVPLMIPGAVQGYRNVRADVTKAQANATFFQAVNDEAARSKLRERLPEEFQQYLDAVTSGSEVENLFIPAQQIATLFQGEALPPVLDAMGVTGAQFEEALGLGADVVVPTSRFVSNLAGSPAAQQLVEDIRFQAGELTLREAKEAAKQAEQAQAALEKLAQEGEPALAEDPELAAIIEERITRPLSERFTPEQAQTMAAAWAAKAKQSAARGESDTPADYIRRIAPIVEPNAEAARAGQRQTQFQRVPQSETVEQFRDRWAGELQTVFITESDDAITLASLIVQPEKRKQGLGTRFMEELIALADNQGKRVLLSPGLRDDRHGTTSRSRLVKFYKRFGFRENKGRNKDFTVSEGMIREPQRRTQFQQAAQFAGADPNDQAQVEEAARLWQELGVDSPYFKRWFGDSKVVDGQGKPLVVYHGTEAEMGPEFAFQVGRKTKRYTTFTEEDVVSQAIFFSPLKEDAESYGANVAEFYLSAKNPFINFRMEKDTEQRQKLRDDAYYIFYPAMYDETLTDGTIRKSIDTNGGISNTTVDDNYVWLDYVMPDGFMDWNHADNPEVIKRMKERGYDSVRIMEPNDASGESWAVFDPAQIKSVFNRGTFDPNDPRILMQSSPVFFSPTRRAVEAMDFKAMPASDLANRIQKAQGIKQEELDDLGLIDWLNGMDGKVSKEQVLAFIEAGGPQIEEKKKGSGFEFQRPSLDSVEAQEAYSDAARKYEDAERYEAQYEDVNDAEIKRRARERFEDEWESGIWDEWLGADTLTAGDTKFGQYQLPGGENYREVLLTAPYNDTNKITELPEGYSVRYEDGEYIVSSGGEDLIGSRESEADAVDQMLRRLNEVAASETRQFESRHWDEPNVLAHFRLNDRTDSEGRRTLFIEEIQSDWHQAGRKKGYRTEGVLPDGYYTRQTSTGNWVVSRPNGVAIGDSVGGTEQEALSNYFRIDRQRDLSGVPDAPFKKSWAMLAFKRVLRMAAEEGYDAVAWTPGEVQAERYDLSKQVDAVRWAEQEDGTFSIGFRKDGVNQRGMDGVAREDLPGVVGKELADKIVAASETEVDGEFSGLDLKVGGEGMKGFYDRILPKEVGKYVAKLDKGAKVGTTELQAPETAGQNDTLRYAVYDPDGQVYDAFPTLEGAEMAAEDAGPGYTVKSPDRLRGVEVWSLPITDKLRENVLAGQPLYQTKPEGPRGAFTPTSNGALLQLFKAADLSSFMHESLHAWVNDMLWIRQEGRASQQTLDDLQKMEDFAGDLTTVDAQELLARAFEGYLREGKAPSRELAGAFQRFRAWMTALYRDIRAYVGRDLTPEIRDVFDRMLAAEAEVDEARQYYESQDTLLASAGKFATQEEMTALLRDKVKANTDAKELRVRAYIRAYFEAAGKDLRAQAEAAVEAMPVFKAQRDILARGPLNAALLDEEFGTGLRKQLKAAHAGLVSQNGVGIGAEDARAHGFPDTASLLWSLVSAGKRSDAVAAETRRLRAQAEAEIRSEFEGEFVPGDESYHSEGKLNIIMAEMRILERAVKAQQTQENQAIPRAFDRISADQIKQTAANLFAAKTMRQAKSYSSFARAEALAAAEAAKLAESGDWAGARAAKLRQAVNHAMVMMAGDLRKTQRRFDKTVAQFTQARRRAKLKLGQEHIDQVDQLLERAGLKPVDPEAGQRQTLAEWMTMMEDERGLGVMPISDRMLGWAGGKIPNMTVDEFTDLADTIKVITTAGRNERKLLASLKGQTVEEAAQDIERQLSGRFKPLKGRNAVNKSVPTKFAETLESTDAFLAKVEHLCIRMDGGYQGPVWNIIFAPVAEADAKELTLNGEDAAEYKRIWGAYSRSERLKLGSVKTTIPEIGEGLTRLQMIAVALNCGTATAEGNYEKLKSGFGWNDAQVQAIIDQLDERDWQTVKDIWKLVGRRWGDVQALNNRTLGRKAEEAPTRIIATRFGDVQGAYYPIAYDESTSWKADAQAEAAALKGSKELINRRPGTNKGYTKPRVVVKDRRIKLDVSPIEKHLQQTAHDLAYREAASDLGKILRHKTTEKAINEYMGRAVFKALNKWATAVSNGEINPVDATSKVLRRARYGATVVNMGWKLSVILPQVVGFVNAVPVLGAKHTTLGIGRLMRNLATGKLGERIEYINERSAEMKNRIKGYDRDVAAASKGLDWSGWAEPVKDTFLWATGFSQAITDYTVWEGAYVKGLKENGGDEKAAALYADSVVRTTQGSGRVKDLAEVQRGPELRRLLTMFYSYFNTMYNLTVSQTSAARGKGAVASSAQIAGTILCTWFISQNLAELLAGRGPDDDEEWTTWALRNTAEMPVGFVPIARDLGRAFTSDRSFGYKLTPAEAAFESIIQVGMDIKKIAQGEEAKLGKHTALALGYWFGLPIRQVLITTSGIHNYITNEGPARDILYTPKR